MTTVKPCVRQELFLLFLFSLSYNYRCHKQF